VIAGWAVATWQLLNGFTLGLPLAYFLTLAGAVAVFVWLRRGRPHLHRRLVVATVAGAMLFVGTGFVLSRPYVRVVDAHPEARRTTSEVAAYSGPPWIFLVAPDENLVWGDATASLRNGIHNIPEKTLFPGLVVVVLAVVGLSSPVYPRWLRWALGVGVVAVSILALGFRESGGLLWPYRFVYELLPGWQAIRVPGRLVTFSSLGLALLAAAGAQRVIGAAAKRKLAGWTAGPMVAAALVAAIVIEGRGLPFDPFDSQAQPGVPPIPPSTAAVPAPQLHLPAERAADNRRYILWSTDGFPDVVNGRSSLNPASTAHLIEQVEGFPNPRTVNLLSRLGVRSVVLHTDLAPDTPWHDAARRPIVHLPVARTRRGPLIIYHLGQR
jgi:hypothetical protein